MPRKPLLLFLVLLCLCLMATAGLQSVAAASAKQVDKAVPPEVIVLILSGMGDSDQVSISYSRVIPTSEADKDIEAIKRVSFWTIRNPKVSTKTTGTPGGKPTTSAQFVTLPIANVREGTIPLEPFITALKRFKTMQVIYLIPGKFVFRGLKDFENDYVKIDLRQSGGSYTYKVTVKNPGFDRLGLPLKMERPVVARKTGPPIAAKVLLVFGVALSGGLLVYVAATLISRRGNAT